MNLKMGLPSPSRALLALLGTCHKTRMTPEVLPG
jgi:hypothetical protein